MHWCDVTRHVLHVANRFSINSGVKFLSCEIVLAIIIERCKNGYEAIGINNLYSTQRKLFQSGFENWSVDPKREVDYKLLLAIRRAIKKDKDGYVTIGNFIVALCEMLGIKCVIRKKMIFF